MRGRSRWRLAAAAMLACASPPARAADTVLRWDATGVQVYQCKREGDHTAWAFIRPEATLTGVGGQVEARHGAGPSWTSPDGSVVYGTVLTSIPAPAAGAVPWLVLRASRHVGTGRMSGVAFVLRTDTDGGAAPPGGCDTGHDGAEARVPYRATYTFLIEPGAIGPDLVTPD